MRHLQTGVTLAFIALLTAGCGDSSSSGGIIANNAPANNTASNNDDPGNNDDASNNASNNATTAPPDVDGDTVLDLADNCPLTSNMEQADDDGDSFGDACDVCSAPITDVPTRPFGELDIQPLFLASRDADINSYMLEDGALRLGGLTIAPIPLGPLPTGASFRVRLTAVLPLGFEGFAVVVARTRGEGWDVDMEDIRLGYGVTRDSVAVELDSYVNDWDPPAPHVAIHRDGNVETPLTSAEPPFPLDDGEPFEVEVAYDGLAQRLDVWVYRRERPDAPTLTHDIDLGAIVGQAPYLLVTSGGSSQVTGLATQMSYQVTSTSQADNDGDGEVDDCDICPDAGNTIDEDRDGLPDCASLLLATFSETYQGGSRRDTPPNTFTVELVYLDPTFIFNAGLRLSGIPASLESTTVVYDANAPEFFEFATFHYLFTDGRDQHFGFGAFLGTGSGRFTEGPESSFITNVAGSRAGRTLHYVRVTFNTLSVTERQDDPGYYDYVVDVDVEFLGY